MAYPPNPSSKDFTFGGSSESEASKLGQPQGGPASSSANFSYVSDTSSSGSTSYGITPRETAYTQLDRDMIALFGRRATMAEKKSYFKMLNAAERRYATKSKSGGQTRTTSKGGRVTQRSTSGSTSTNYQFDSGSFRYEYLVGLAGKYISAGKSFGGEAGNNYNEIQTYAANMGLSLTERSAIADTIATVLGKGDVNTLKQDYRKRAMSLYGGLAERLNTNPNLTVRDAASDYIEAMSSMLDIDGRTVSLQDNTLQKALTAMKDNKPYTMTLNEFKGALRQDTRFKYSNMAKQEANNLGASLAQAMGFGSR